MNCPVCGGLAAAGASRCAQCGSQLATAERRTEYSYSADGFRGPRDELPSNPIDWYKRVLTKYFELDGRATRSEYWWFMLVNVLAGAVLGLAGLLVGLHNLHYLYGLAVIVPSFCVTIRRLHDTGRTGLWWLISFIPLIGGLIILFFTTQDSEPGTNRFGPNPKGIV